MRAASARQMAATALLLLAAMLLARFSWAIPVVGNAEDALYDLRGFVMAPRVAEQDPRIQIVAYTDQTLIAVKKRSPLDRGLLARALKAIDGMGAKAVGIDILFDQPQDEDDELVAALRAMKTPTFVAYTDIATNKDDIRYEQQVYLQSFMKRLEGSNARPASIMLSNADGATRLWPAIIPGVPPVLGRAMIGAVDPAKTRAFDGYTGSIRYRLSGRDSLDDGPDTVTPLYSELPVDVVAAAADPDLAAAIGQQIAGRYVLIGGDIVDTDQLTTTLTAATSRTVPGITVHADLIAQMLDGVRLTKVSAWERWAVAFLVILAAVLTSLVEARIWKVVPFFVAELALIGGLPFWLAYMHVDTYGTPAFGWIAGWIVAFLAVSSAVRASGAVERRFAQDALGKYLPRDIAQEIIDNPERLTLSGSKHELYILFSDLEGFTKLSHQLEPEVVAKLLNEYLDRLSAVVLEHGGIVDKYVGDAVVAFWGAPISRPDDGRKAALAAYAMWQAGEEFRKSVDPSLPPIGRTRVGQHFGEAVVGNFGGERRIQYTALGDAMNTAARLESANKSLGTSIIASREFAERSGLDWWRPLGKVVLRGRASPVEICEPAPDFPETDRAALAEAVGLIGQDTPAAVAKLTELACAHPHDTALACLIERTRELKGSEAYVLG
ncbi:CHASE2 domain-containing protein [Novosphingobium album (ex Hu et al. 2023)]|uniref:Adenylate/guanylate cyclase domain-containing protein n=1 Tax=Novosphingobium album (ex Hu et al. 2023) TaxID=2930093 RepID=A0ABT0AXX2_9SPHN|nr:adenylate/guanylate cyclase domain-containing protein [Novosphingobium album (ex Hu et al. 2023)]MCJ2177493.1 adenylate/guanylate cyclase domain-containing protein [Novosphingobium album (ex Hu et al. 2023)]